MKKLFTKFFGIFTKTESDTATATANYTSAFNFEQINTIAQFEIVKQAISDAVKKESASGCIYTSSDIAKAKKMLSDLRKNKKCDYDRFLCITQKVKASSDTARTLCDTATAHTIDVQKNIRANALSALNYAIRKYNHNEIVTISEIKSAFNALNDTDIYKYYAVSTMQFNARALLARCVNAAMQSKVKAQKESAKNNK